jgi:threonine dehydrogenase-like Zn-dependent dehydrogenase
VPFGSAFGKGLTFRMGQTHVHRYLVSLLERIKVGDIDPSFVITHRVAFEDVPDAYAMLQEKRDGCNKVVIDPAARASSKERPS